MKQTFINEYFLSRWPRCFGPPA